jgi:hypothetical protein
MAAFVKVTVWVGYADGLQETKKPRHGAFVHLFVEKTTLFVELKNTENQMYKQ